MLITFPVAEADEKDALNIEGLSNGWRISVKGDKPWAFDFDVTSYEGSADIALLAINLFGKPCLVWGKEIFNDRGALSVAVVRNNIQSAGSFLAAFAVDPDRRAHCFVMRRAFVGVLDHVTVVGDSTFLDVFEKNVPSMRPYIYKVRAKMSLLSELIYADSFAAIEAQLDLLTKVLFEVVKLSPTSELSDSAIALKKVVALQGVTNIHSDEKIINDIESHKKRLRKMQETYFKMREGNKDG